MPTEQIMAYCENEGRQTLHIKKSPNHLLHLVLSIFTGGLWLIGWGMIAVSSSMSPPQCTECGDQNESMGQAAASIFLAIIIVAIGVYLSN